MITVFLSENRMQIENVHCRRISTAKKILQVKRSNENFDSESTFKGEMGSSEKYIAEFSSLSRNTRNLSIAKVLHGRRLFSARKATNKCELESLVCGRIEGPGRFQLLRSPGAQKSHRKKKVSLSTQVDICQASSFFCE